MTDEPIRRRRGLRRAGARHRRRRHQPPVAPLSRPLVRCARGLLEGPSAPRPVRQARLRHQRHGRRHGAQPRQQPGRRPCHGRARARRRPSASYRLVRPELPQVLGVAGLALPPGVGCQRAMAELVRDRVDGREPIADEVIVALGRTEGATRSPSATRSTARRCRMRCSTRRPPISASSSRRRRCASRTAPSTAGKAAIPTPAAARAAARTSGTTSRRCPSSFPALERSMREADYAYNHGRSRRHELPAQPAARHADSTERPCADGQFGNVLKLYRDWKLSRRHATGCASSGRVPSAHRVCLEPGQPDRWDPDQTGVLWGRQHHTLDMELFGPNSWLTGFYLGALKAGAEMAEALGETDDRRALRLDLREGPAWVDAQPLQRRVLHPEIDLGDRSCSRPSPAPRSRRPPRRRRRDPLLERRARRAQVPVRRGLPHRPGRSASGMPASTASATSSTPASGGEPPGDLPAQLRAAARRHRTIPAASSASTTRPARSSPPGRTRAEAGRPGALRAGDHARHGIRLRPDADAIRHGRGGHRGLRGGARPLRRRQRATRGTRSSAARTTPARWRAGARSSSSPASPSTPAAAISASIPRSGWAIPSGALVGPSGWGTVEIGEGRMLLTVLGGTLVLAGARPAGRPGRRRRRLAQRSAAGLRGDRQGARVRRPAARRRATASRSTRPSISIAGLPDVSRL